MWSKLDSFKFALDVWMQVVRNRNIIDPLLARENAKNSTRDFYEIICPKYWINVEYKFWDDSLNKYPDLVKQIKNYIEIWEDIKNGPLLYLWNHQSFWIEAVWAYDYFPINWRIILKDDLLKPPFFWKWIKSIDPIIHYRKKSGSEEYRIKQIENQVLEWKAVLIYPEWTRSKDWNIRNFKTSLYEPAYNIIKNSTDNISKEIILITSDTYWNKDMNWVLPTTMEKSLIFKWKLNPWKIIYTIDIISIESYDSIKKFNSEIRDIIKWNLSHKL